MVYAPAGTLMQLLISSWKFTEGMKYMAECFPLKCIIEGLNISVIQQAIDGPLQGTGLAPCGDPMDDMNT